VKFFVLLVLLSTHAFAQKGAELLLKKTGTSESTESHVPEASDLKLTDAYLQTLFMEWRQAKGLDPKVDEWLQLVLAGKFLSASQGWATLQSQLNAETRPMAQHTWVYLAWKLQLPQTFVNAYLTERMNPVGGERLRFALEQVINEEARASWVAEQRPSLNPEQTEYLLSLAAPLGLELELTAFAARYSADHAARVLALLPMGHPQSFILTTTAVMNWTRKKEIGEAGKLLKRRTEPELERTKAVKELSRYYLTLGRLLYQAGAYEASEAFYAKVPRGVLEYIPARTERTWALLRLKRVSELRGELTSLSHQLFADRFLPEVALVRSVSNLKLCRYDAVVEDFDAFIAAHKIWAQRIEAGLSDPAKAVIDQSDERIHEVVLAQAARELELERLKKLQLNGEETYLQGELARTQAELVAQKKRFWQNRKSVLEEAIRKMKFVRIEAMSQVRLAQTERRGTEVTDITRRIDSSRKRGEQVYPVDSVYWPDEIFNMHAAATSQCGGNAL
jgi:hypothetical protein